MYATNVNNLTGVYKNQDSKLPFLVSFVGLR